MKCSILFIWDFKKIIQSLMPLLVLLNPYVTPSINGYLDGIFLDSRKAFDNLNHSALLYKLNHYGIRSVVYDSFQSNPSKQSSLSVLMVLALLSFL